MFENVKETNEGPPEKHDLTIMTWTVAGEKTILQDCFAKMNANIVLLAKVPNLEQIPEADRLDPQQLVADLSAGGQTAEYLHDVDSIVTYVTTHAIPGDIVCVLSNGGFGGIHQKLVQAIQITLSS